MSRIEIISASAGSGKTYRLTEVLADALVDGGARPEGILATTFTLRAAAELRQRARARLFEAGRPVDAQRLATARIGTIHSVCARLVSDFAFVLGLSPRLRVIDETRAASALQRSLADAASETERHRLAAIGSRFWSDFDWQREVRSVVDLARVNRISADQLRASADRSWRDFRELLGEPAARGDLLDRHLRRAAESFVAQIDLDEDRTKTTARALERVEAARDSLTHRGRLRWKAWASLAGLRPGKKSEPLAEAVRTAAVTQDRHPGLHGDVREAIDLVFTIAARALAAYEEYKQTWGLIDFVDQEVKALELLAEPAVREQLSTELDLVLVDEFQDTSPLQLALFFRLAELAPRSVWVGDAKQAIYAFRGTDPALMDAAIEHILGGAEPERLPYSWRSRPELVEVTSDLFGQAFSARDLPTSRVTLESRRPSVEALGPGFERWQLEATNKAAETKALAAAVRELLADPDVQVADRASGEPRRPTPADVSVLCRRNATAETVARGLEALGVPARIPRRGLLATPEARVLVAALRLWVDPGDALAAAEIARILRRPETGDRWLEMGLEEPGGGAFRRLPPVAGVLAARREHPDAGTATAVDLCLAATGVREACRRWGDSDQRLANLEVLRSQAVRHSRLQEGACTVTGFVASLDRLEEMGADGRAVPAGTAAVAVTTWHGAKGLEWPITVLFELDTAEAPSPLGVRVVGDFDNFDPRDPLAGRWIRYWPNPYHPAQRKMPFHRRLADHRATASTLASWEAERLRLLYVGWTRARDRLVLAGRPHRLDRGILESLRGDGEPPLSEPENGQADWGGRRVDLVCRRTGAAEASPRTPSPGTGPRAAGPRAHPPAVAPPSAAAGTAAVVGTARLGSPMPASVPDGGLDRVSAVVHGFLAADGPALAGDDRRTLATELIDRWQMAASLTTADLSAAADSLYRWIEDQWPGAAWYRELAIEGCLAGGTLVRGAADLVLEAEDYLVLIDHKCLAGGAEHAARAAAFGGQLRAYGEVLTAALGKPVEHAYVHLPLAGLAVELALTDRESGDRGR